MPNHCQNILIIAGSKKDLEEFTSKSEDKEFLLETYLPTPENPGEHLDDGKPHYLDAFTAELGGDDWYTWRIKNWGTKWDVYETSKFLFVDDGNIPEVPELENIMEIIENIHKHEIRVSFLSAWSPPEEGVCTISKGYPELLFTLIFCEVGNNFAGETVFMNGKVLVTKSGEVEEYMEKYDFTNAF